MFCKDEEEGRILEHIDIIPGLAAMNLADTVHQQHITAEALREMSQPVRSLLSQEKVYAVEGSPEGKRRYARVSICRNSQALFLHHLREEQSPPPPNVYLVEHRDLLKLENPSSRFAFLELSCKGSNLGKVIIRLHENSGGANQFKLLCTGEVGPSYANTKLLEVWEKGRELEYVSCGDYENNNGTGGKAVITGLGDRELYNGPWKAGTVWGFLLWNCVAGQFCILTRDVPGMVLSSPAFGIVEEGLEVLTNAIGRSSDVRDICIANCGIVLPRLV